MADKWDYERLDENYEIKHCPRNDYDGSITGHIVFGVKEWFDEHPEERKRLGWIKHIHHSTKDIDYDHQKQYLVRSVRQIDEYTVEDVHYIMDKSEEQMLFEEMLEISNSYNGGIIFSILLTRFIPKLFLK